MNIKSNKKSISLSKTTKIALNILGNLIKSARSERGISQADLASRLNAGRSTVIAIEKGEPTVAIGAYFEAANIVGVQLLAENMYELNKLATNLSNLTSVLPKRVGRKKEDLNDDF